MTSLHAHFDREASPRPRRRLWRMRLAMLLLSAATAALGAEASHDAPPLIGAMTVVASRLPPEAMLASDGAMRDRKPAAASRKDSPASLSSHIRI